MLKSMASIACVSPSRPLAEAFCQRLDLSGQEISFINMSNWLAKPVNGFGVVILLLPKTERAHLDVLAAMLNTPSACYLGIFSSPITSEEALVLQACADCCDWDSDLSELKFRFQKLLASAYGDINKDEVLDHKIWGDLNLIGSSKAFLEVQAKIKWAANCDAAVLIEGETGCGKEMVARAIHYMSLRNGQPFIPVNCGAIPDHLIENELFGHEKGAYTDAKESYLGAIAQANGGTLFLDEIEALSAKGQVTLLRFLEDKIIKPLGSQHSKKVNVRVIVASNACLAELAGQNLFRKDLLYRLNLLYIGLPPLRQRQDDIKLLADYFLRKYQCQYKKSNKQIHHTTLSWMQLYPWPGNVRELENFIHKAFLFSDDNYIWPVDKAITLASNDDVRRKLPDRRLNCDFDSPFNEAKNQVINHFEKQYLSKLISQARGNVTLAADKAQKERRCLGKLLKKYNIVPEDFRK